MREERVYDIGGFKGVDLSHMRAAKLRAHHLAKTHVIHLNDYGERQNYASL